MEMTIKQCSLCFVPLTKCYPADNIKKNEMGGTCGTYGVKWGDLKDRDHLEDQGADGKIILKWMLRNWCRDTWNGLLWVRIGIGGGYLRM